MDKYYAVTENDKYGDDESVSFRWEEGNQSCDCNRSTLIQLQCDPNFPEMECGDSIKLINLTILDFAGETKEQT